MTQQKKIGIIAGPNGAGTHPLSAGFNAPSVSRLPDADMQAAPAALARAAKLYLQHVGGFLSSRAAEERLVRLGHLPAVEAEELFPGDALDEVVVTDTIPLSREAAGCPKIRQLSVAQLIAETIQRIAKGESVMSLFSEQENLF